MSKMQAFLVEKPLEASVVSLDIPTPGEDGILLEVKAAGVCGTDIHIYKGEYLGTYPRVPGHEFSGVVAAVGSKVTRFQPGQRVAADPNIFCEACDACKQNNQNFCTDFAAVGVTRHGAFAQYLTVPERCVFDIGDLSFTEGSLIEPLSCVVFGQQQGGIPLGAHVLVIGAGPIGLMHIQLAAMNGAASVTATDLFPQKLELARQLGADFAYTSQEFESTSPAGKYEVVIDCTGVPKVVEGAVRYVKDGGKLLLFGVCPEGSRISVDPYEIFHRQLTLTSTYALKKTFGIALDLLKNGKIKVLPLVGGRHTLDKAPGTFHSMLDSNSGLKQVFYPNGIVE